MHQQYNNPCSKTRTKLILGGSSLIGIGLYLTLTFCTDVTYLDNIGISFLCTATLMASLLSISECYDLLAEKAVNDDNDNKASISYGSCSA